MLERGTAWLDTGTHASMMQAAEFVRVVEERQGWKIGCIEEIAWRRGFIDDAQLQALAEPLQKSGYGDYLLGLLDEPTPSDGLSPVSASSAVELPQPAGGRGPR